MGRKRKYGAQLDPDFALRQKAELQVKFRRNVRAFVFVNLALIAIWFATTPMPYTRAYFWPAWSIFGWGLGLFFSFRKAFMPGKEEEIEMQVARMKEEREEATSR